MYFKGLNTNLVISKARKTNIQNLVTTRGFTSMAIIRLLTARRNIEIEAGDRKARIIQHNVINTIPSGFKKVSAKNFRRAVSIGAGCTDGIAKNRT